MLKKIKISKGVLMTLLALLMLSFATEVDAQSSRKRKKKRKKAQKEREKQRAAKERAENGEDVEDEETVKLADRLWYGANAGLGFSGNSSFNTFNASLYPMVGYKITPNFSAGPRIGLTYWYIKGPASDGNIRKVTPISYSAGAFMRHKLFFSIFAHAEYEFESRASVLTDGLGRLAYDVQTQKVQTVRAGRSNALLGLGYSSGSELAYEISLLYNFLEPEDSLSLPFVIRVGFNYRF